MPEIIISDSSCLITLTNAGHLDLLRKVYGRITTTSLVLEEYGLSVPAWIEIRDPSDRQLVERFNDLVDGGEASAIALAMETRHSVVILDDLAARRLAKDLDLPHTGTIGVLLKAKAQGAVSALEPLLNDLKRVGFRLSPTLEEQALRMAGERPLCDHQTPWLVHDRVCTHILAGACPAEKRGGRQQGVLVRGGFSDYEENYTKRVGDIMPKRLKYKKLVRG